MTRNTRQLELLLQQSDRAALWMVIWFGVSIIGCILTVFVWMSPNEHRFGISMSVAMLSGGFFAACIQAFKYARLNRIINRIDEPPPPNLGQPVFESNVRPPRIVVQTSHNQWLVSKYRNINERQWRRLHDALRNYDGLWSRDRSLKMSGIFTADETGIILTAAGEYAQLRDDFERMSIIEKRAGSWYVTREGWLRLEEMARL